MSETLKAIKYENLDHALRALSEVMELPAPIFDDAGEEPQGLLAVVPSDRLPEETFYQLFDIKKGILVEVENQVCDNYKVDMLRHNSKYHLLICNQKELHVQDVFHLL